MLLRAKGAAQRIWGSVLNFTFFVKCFFCSYGLASGLATHFQNAWQVKTQQYLE